MAISSLTRRLREANERTEALQESKEALQKHMVVLQKQLQESQQCLQESQQKLLVYISAESLRQQQHQQQQPQHRPLLQEGLHIDREHSRDVGGESHTVPSSLAKAVVKDSSQHPNCCDVHVPGLIRAAEHGEEKVVAGLLEAGEDPKAADDMGLTALHCACKKGHANIVSLLFSWGADPNAAAAGCHDQTPLHYACKYGHSDCVSLLLENGADPEVMSQQNKTPLHHAKEKKHEAIEAALRIAIGARAAAPPRPGCGSHLQIPMSNELIRFIINHMASPGPRTCVGAPGGHLEAPVRTDLG
jgi:hypothetical protein